jgi:two-component system cell cycle sensor histidine kinase/response regulator CckA
LKHEAGYFKILGAGIMREPDNSLYGNETVLVVDDTQSIRSFLSHALPVFGYTVISAEDGMEGLKKFREHKEKIHVMLLDVVMPKLNGMELFKEIKQLEPNSKVLFMTGYNEILDRNNLQDKMRCISKPFAINSLLKELREVLDKS